VESIKGSARGQRSRSGSGASFPPVSLEPPRWREITGLSRHTHIPKFWLSPRSLTFCWVI